MGSKDTTTISLDLSSTPYLAVSNPPRASQLLELKPPSCRPHNVIHNPWSTPTMPRTYEGVDFSLLLHKFPFFDPHESSLFILCSTNRLHVLGIKHLRENPPRILRFKLIPPYKWARNRPPSLVWTFLQRSGLGFVHAECKVANGPWDG